MICSVPVNETVVVGGETLSDRVLHKARPFFFFSLSRFRREMREFFNYATSLIIMLLLYMFQFTMLFTI